MRLAAVRRETGVWHKAMPPPHAKIPGVQQHAQAVLFLYLRVSLSRVVGPDGPTHSGQLSLPPSSDGVLSGSLGRLGSGYRVCATRSKSVCTPVAPPLEPSLCSQLPTPLWWRSRSPALPHRHLRPPLPWHALYVLYYVYASACPVCGMGACGVCVVSECECSLRVGSVGLPRLVVGCASVHAWACPYQRLEKGGGHGL